MIPNRDLDHQFSMLSRKHKACFDKLIFGILTVHPWFLKELAKSPGCSQKELSKMLHITPASVTGSIQKAEASGYIRRELDPNDLRRTNVFLTDKGVELLDKVDDLITEISDTFLQGFTEDEKETLTNYFQRMSENLDGIHR